MIISITEASKQSGAPSRQTLYTHANSQNPPSFIVKDENGKPKIDADHPEWKRYIDIKFKEQFKREKSVPRAKRESKKKEPQISIVKKEEKTKSTGKKKEEEKAESYEDDSAVGILLLKAREAEYRKMIADAETAEYKAKIQKLNFQDSVRKTVHTDFAKFAFYGYWKRLHTELLGINKRVEAKVQNFVQAGDWQSIVSMYSDEHEEILLEAMEAHKRDLEEYEIEADYDK